jgi:drug/metabolite transporter (DMT)-like permease
MSLQPKSNNRQAYVTALIAVGLWSTVATGFKLGLQHFEPAQLVMLGTCVSTLIFWIAAIPGRRFGMSPAGYRAAALMGLLNPTLYYLVLLEAYARLPAQIAQPLNYTWAVTLAILAVPILKQRLGLRAITGILVSYVGVVVLLTQGRTTIDTSLDTLGIALALLSTLLWATYWLVNTRLEIAPRLLMAWSFLFATPLVVGICIVGPGMPEMGVPALIYGTWVGAVEMGVTFLLWQHALRKTSKAAQIGQLIFLSPFLSLILIATVLGEVIQPSSIAGLAIIVCGMLINRTPEPGAQSENAS